jgi:hypothetical protein
LSCFAKFKQSKDGLEYRCKACRSTQRREYYAKNKEKSRSTNEAWRAQNIEKLNNSQKEYRRNRYHSDIEFRLRCILRTRLANALNGTAFKQSFINNLGCSIEQLKKYLESQFQPGMSWDNYGYYGWHVDHIESLKHFNLKNNKELKKACHYTNLQPLWWQDNLRKQ